MCLLFTKAVLPSVPVLYHISNLQSVCSWRTLQGTSAEMDQGDLFRHGFCSTGNRS